MFALARPAAFGQAPPTPRVTANAQTNRIFFARHPERRGRPISPAEPQLVREWLAIRESLRQAPPIGAAVPAMAERSSPALAVGMSSCPIEDPFPMSIHKPGSGCGPQGRKCWPAEGWVDIIDSDMPCNDESRRSPVAYVAVLDYFNVAHPGNARYAGTARDTFCNIYVHDVTRAMRASIPHWIRDPAQTGHKPIGWRESAPTQRSTGSMRWAGLPDGFDRPRHDRLDQSAADGATKRSFPSGRRSRGCRGRGWTGRRAPASGSTIAATGCVCRPAVRKPRAADGHRVEEPGAGGGSRCDGATGRRGGARHCPLVGIVRAVVGAGGQGELCQPAGDLDRHKKYQTRQLWVHA